MARISGLERNIAYPDKTRDMESILVSTAQRLYIKILKQVGK